MRIGRQALIVILLTPLIALVPGVGSPTPADAGAQTDLVGPAGSGEFGAEVLVLANGNIVVSDPLFDLGGLTDVGAVRLYDGSTQQLISTLTGSTANDQVGWRLTEVGNSNFVVQSMYWNNVGAPSAGAATWVSGTVGLDGVVSAGNSLVGTHAMDLVGGLITVLTNGNYVVASSGWSNGVALKVGASTWGAANGGVVGAVSIANSLVGAKADDGLGSSVIALTNGHYVIRSPFHDHPSFADTGAVTWGNGLTGTNGGISNANSIVGLKIDDRVGRGGVFALTNGNYVIASPFWNSNTAVDVGAVTLADGTTPSAHAVLSGNSLHGEHDDDRVGGDQGGIEVLTNGNYVVASSTWDHGVLQNAGAATWRSGATAAVGDGEAVSVSNSLHGSWHDDEVGWQVVALTNGNYVVGSPQWHAGVVDVGALTWGDGLTGTAGEVTATNSLVGTHFDDEVGVRVMALANGHYVAQSYSWRNGGVENAGAATWGNGNGGTVGPVTADNSLVGTRTDDRVGVRGVELTNGNYVLYSEDWDNGLVVDGGATTWGSGTGGQVGPISASNSIVGGSVNDGENTLPTPLPSGDFVLSMPHWDNGAIVDAGIVSVHSGTVATTGDVDPASGAVGAAAGDLLGMGFGVDNVQPFDDGSFAFWSRYLSNGAIAQAGGVTYWPPAGQVRAATGANSVLGTVLQGVEPMASRLSSGGAVVVPRPKSNVVTLYRPDLTPPSFAQPADVLIDAEATAQSAIATYPTPSAIEDSGEALAVTCAPASGSVFALGSTTVTCSATNAESITGTTSFIVTVVNGADYVALPPSRIADTRAGQTTVDGQFAGIGALAVDSTLELRVAGRGGVPAEAAAVSLNVTVTEAGGDGYLTVYPCGSPRPTASNLNYVSGGTVPNAVITKIGTGGNVCIYAQQSLHLVVDVNGAFPPTTTFVATNPARVLDTRPGQTTADGAQQGGGFVGSGSITTLQITGRAGVPADAASVALNVTVTEPAAPGYATVFPCGTEPPLASNLNYSAGLTTPNLVIAKIGAIGAVCIYSQAGAHLIADVLGHFPASTTYTGLEPARLLDTRLGASTIDGESAGLGVQPVGAIIVLRVGGRGGVPSGANTAVLNVTASEPAAAGYLTVYPCRPDPSGTQPPLASNVNYAARQTIPNAVLTKLGPEGHVCITNSQPTQVIADVAGYFPS